MWLVIFIVVAAVLWWFINSSSKGTTKQAKSATTDPTPVTVSLSVSQGFSSSTQVGIQPTEHGISIGTNLPLPLTLVGLDRNDAERLAKAIEQRDTYTARGWLTTLVAAKNIRCKEIDDWISSYKPKFEAAVNQAITSSQDWAVASDLDKEDLLAEFQLHAIENLSTRPSDTATALSLLTEEPSDLSVDDELLARFGDRQELYPVLLSAFSYGDKVQIVPIGSYNRKEYEELAALGYLKRGSDIDIAAILSRMTLKQMTEVAGEAATKKFTRKAAAIEFLKTLPDLSERISKVIAYRELFQVAPLEGIDVTEIAASYHYSGEVARLILNTLQSGAYVADEVARAKEFTPEGWELSADDCCPDCKKLDGKTWKRPPQKLPPFHIGCSCQLSWL